MTPDPFSRYARFIQEYIYRHKWTELREVQVEACAAILDTDTHVLLASSTASGKTEAAFFPILTLLDQQPPNSMGVLYISPLKALINDQFRRLDKLLEDSHIPVWPWHGDVLQSVKTNAKKTARGVVQITPESLEAMLMRCPGDARRLFCDLRFVVIDEIYAMMQQDRGRQTQCLLSRLERIAGCHPRRVGLSATLSDPQEMMDLLAAGDQRGVTLVGNKRVKRRISVCAESFFLPDDCVEAGRVERQYNKFIYDSCRATKCIIFANSRSGTEKIASAMKNVAAERGDRDVFYVHHGNISASVRQDAETALREGTGPAVTAATVTLELGIDIGDLDLTVELGAPFTCSSFVQRLGRSGRRTGVPKMMFVGLENLKGRNVVEQLPWSLLRAIAIVQLYAEDRWVEPILPKPRPYSLLVHQTLSELKSDGELRPAQLANKVLTLPPFVNSIGIEDYKLLLRNMVVEEYLERTETGTLIIGLKGEPIVNHYSFYSVFESNQRYKVRCGEHEIGSLDQPRAPGEVFILAAKPWQVEATDEDRKIIYMHPAKGNKVASWFGGGGWVHTRVIQRIRQVLTENVDYHYLAQNAANILKFAQMVANKIGILDTNVLQIGERRLLLCPWVGDRQMSTIESLMRHGLKEQLEVTDVGYAGRGVEIETLLTAPEFMERLQSIEVAEDDPCQVLSSDSAPMLDRYDAMVPKPLRRMAYLYNEMDVPGALDALRGLSLPLDALSVDDAPPLPPPLEETHLTAVPILQDDLPFKL